jgi:CDP-diacylglycerol--serine O-phosphatidyltransferase
LKGNTLKRRPAVLYVLPNLFTASSVFCGLYAIIQAASGNGIDSYYRAAIAILFAAIFDSADGRVARLTKTESDFGLQFDSLADVVSFGVAPAILVYHWALSGFGIFGLIVAFGYTACGAIRLARFNVIAADEDGGAPKHFFGLPIPLAATSIISLVLVQHKTGIQTTGWQPLILIIVCILSVLMISHIRYRTFKNIRASRLSLLAFISLVCLVLFASWMTSLALIFMVVCNGLIALGPAEEFLRFVRRRLTGSSKINGDKKTA